jgi:hypothetical protein
LLQVRQTTLGVNQTTHKAQNAHGQSGFATTSPTQQPDPLSSFEIEGDVLQNYKSITTVIPRSDERLLYLKVGLGHI